MGEELEEKEENEEDEEEEEAFFLFFLFFLFDHSPLGGKNQPRTEVDVTRGIRSWFGTP